MKTEKYSFDVAFAFCEKDEGIVTDINNIIQTRMRTFLYSKSHEKIAGTHGEKTVKMVFGEGARIVFVLYRQGWGTTHWTRIEETTIKNRGFEEGFDFITFAPIDKTETVPEWLPKTQIWFGLDRWGIEGAASVIEARVQEAGGRVTKETINGCVSKRSKSLRADKDIQALLDSDNGVKIANSEITKLFVELETALSKTLEIDTKGKFIFQKEKNLCAIMGEGISIIFYWSASFSNTLRSSALYFTLFEGRITIAGRDYFPFQEPRRLKEFVYN